MIPTRSVTVLVAAAASITLAGCRSARSGGAVEVLYAGSLTATMEQELGPAFQEETGREFRGEGRGSVAAAHELRAGVRRPDVYVTADTSTLPLLGDRDPGWAIAFARGELAIGYDADGRAAAALDSAAVGRPPWYEVVTRPGFRLGRTDPDLDPKGYRTLWMFHLAERYYGVPGLADRLLAAAPNDRVFPEENLAVRVQTGQLDAAIFYLAEARAHDLSVIRVPEEVGLGDSDAGVLYADLRYTDRQGRTFRGAPILYAATIPANARSPAAGVAFIAFLTSPRGRAILSERGFPPWVRALGDTDRVPPALGRVLEADTDTPR